MSFSEEQKTEILATEIKNKCCKAALLQGMLSSRAFFDDSKIVFPSSSSDVIQYASALLSEVYSKSSCVNVPLNGGRRRFLTFECQSLEKYVFPNYQKAEPNERCAACRSSFLRGVFLGSGRVTDPEKQYLLEFSLGERSEIFLSYFQDLGLTPRISKKRSETVIYFKSSAEIEDIFALANMNQAAFALMNEKIQSEIRNSVNRIANCETNNIEKAVLASMNQISLIERLSAKGLLSLLPDELEQTARARMEHRDLSLSQLAALITPPISKPGLSHRLKRITAIAEELLDSD